MLKQRIILFGILIFCIITFKSEVVAQFLPIDAIILRMSGEVKVIEAGIEIAPKVKMKLLPGYIISTNNNGRLDILLSDGSRINVFPGTTIKLNQFRYLTSPRDLLSVVSGRIKVKINHPVGIPNPYKLSTAAASIAVRGTEFIVDVESSGNTSVFVIDGLVEVQSTYTPSNRRLLSAGERAIIKLTGDISLNISGGPGSELNGMPRSKEGFGWVNREITDAVIVKSMGSTPIAFSAFNDVYFDSADNPAYSIKFGYTQGRVTLLPSTGPHGYDKTSYYGNPVYWRDITFYGEKYGRPSKWDQNLNSQLSIYTPLFNSKLIVGASATSSRMNLRNYSHSLGNIPYHDNTGKVQSYKFNLDSNFKLNTTKLLLSGAMFLDKKKKTSVGVAFDYLFGESDFLKVFDQEYFDIDQMNYRTTRLYYNTHAINSDLEGKGLTIGITRDFSAGKSLGVHTRFGAGKSDDNSQRVLITKFPDFTCNPEVRKSTLTNKSFEAVFKWRSPILKSLIYGIEGSYLKENIHSINQKTLACDFPEYLQGRLHSNTNYPSVTDDPSSKTRIGGGLGYKLKSRTLLSFDMTITRINSRRTVTSGSWIEDLYYGQIPVLFIKNTRYSYHTGIITNPWKQSTLSLSVYRVPLYRPIYYKGLVRSTIIPTLGAGWNFRTGAQIQYYISTDTMPDSMPGFSPSHSLMLRWNFDLKKEQ